MIENFVCPFDLSRAPLVRACLIKRGEAEHILIVDMHHIVSDGTSLDVFVKDFMTLYRDERLPVLRVRYRDYSEWQAREKRGGFIKEQEVFWLSRFAGEVPLLNLPIDYPRPMVQHFEGRRLNFETGEEETASLRSWAFAGRRNNVYGAPGDL